MNSVIIQMALTVLLKAIAGVSKDQWELMVGKVGELEDRAIDSTIKQKEAAVYVKTLTGAANGYIVNLLVELSLWAARSTGAKA